MSIFKGSGVALITPFKDGKIDYNSVEKLLEWHIECGTDALIICGTTGEASTLSDLEKISLVEFVCRKIDGRLPVIAGSGTNDTSKSIYLSKEFRFVGADGLLVVTPYYNKTSQDGLIRHYTMIADSTDLPLIMYSVKSRTGLNISPKTVNILKEHPNIVAIKEASGDITQIAEIATMIDEDFDLYSGNDDHTIPIMSLGGIGCISTVANIIPKEFHKMTADYMAGRTKEAAASQLKMIPLIKGVFYEVNPIPIKAALNIMGMIKREYRMPLCQPSNETLYVLYDVMKSYGLNIEYSDILRQQ